jgi:hypothetical protein
MDFFTSISKIVDSIAWPVVVFLILYRGRDDILKLVRTLKSIKVSDQFEAIFSDEAEKLRSLHKKPQTLYLTRIQSNMLI